MNDFKEIPKERDDLPQTGDPDTRDAISEVSESEKANPEAIIKDIKSLVGNSAVLAEIKKATEKALFETSEINRTANLDQLMEKMRKEEIDGVDFEKNVNELIKNGEIEFWDVKKKGEVEFEKNGLQWVIAVDRNEAQGEDLIKFRGVRYLPESFGLDTMIEQLGNGNILKDLFTAIVNEEIKRGRVDFLQFQNRRIGDYIVNVDPTIRNPSFEDEKGITLDGGIKLTYSPETK